MPTQLAVVTDGWFDGDVRHDARTTLVVDAGVVTAVEHGDQGAGLAARGYAVERGGYLLPGLADAHVHLFLDGAPTDGTLRSAHLRQPVAALTDAGRASARQALACGVTLVRDAGDKFGINHRLRAEAAWPDSGLPRIRSGGLGVKRPKRYGAFMARDVTDRAEIVAAVTELAADNDDLKVILTGIIDFDAGAVTDAPQFTLEELELIVATARRYGRSTFVHCSGQQGLEIAAAAGVGSIEHGFFMSEAVLDSMLANGVAWTPTFCPVHFQWAHPEAVGWSAQTVGHLRRILDGHAAHLELAYRKGVTLLLGTDAGSMGVEHGKAVCDELECFVAAGLSLEAALQAATANIRRHFGDPHPTLAVGAPFEAVLLDASPFVEFAALRAPRKVWRN